jgi:regulator of nonsense transcripts 1
VLLRRDDGTIVVDTNTQQNEQKQQKDMGYDISDASQGNHGNHGNVDGNNNAGNGANNRSNSRNSNSSTNQHHQANANGDGNGNGNSTTTAANAYAASREKRLAQQAARAAASAQNQNASEGQSGGVVRAGSRAEKLANRKANLSHGGENVRNDNVANGSLNPNGNARKERVKKVREPRERKPRNNSSNGGRKDANGEHNKDGGHVAVEDYVEDEEQSDEDIPEAPVQSAVSKLNDISRVSVSITSSTTTKSRIPTAEELANSAESKKKVVAKKMKAKKGGGVNGMDSASPAFVAACKSFNSDVRNLADGGDVDKLVVHLDDNISNGLILDANTLELMLKTLVVGAQFEIALRSLKSNCNPDTLDANQTERILSSLPQNLRNSSAFTAADMINQLCIATNFKNGQTARAYFMRIVRGIALEFLEEATSARDRICSAHCERLVRTGQCVVDAQLRKGRKDTEILVLPGHQLGVFIPEIMDSRGIQAGDAVSILPYAGPYPMSAESLDRNMVEATVTSATPLILRLHDKANRTLLRMLTDGAPGNVYRIDKLANRMGYNRQLEAARIVAAPPENTGNPKKDLQRPSEELIKGITAMDENIAMQQIMQGAANGKYNEGRDQGEITSTSALCAQAVPLRESEGGGPGQEDEESIRAYSRLALEKTGQLDGLNSSQRLAVHHAVTNRLTLVQGPPGPGKTAVAIKIMSHWAKISNSPVLATSDSNIAVDNLVEGCAKAGLVVVRLGRPEAIRPELLKYCVDKPGVEKQLGQGQGGGSYGGDSTTDGGGGGGGGASGAQIFKEKMRAIKNAQIVCCTCIGSGGEILDGMFFERVLVDEATQATEPATLVPLTRGCKQLVLVGDHCQLPPTVLSTRAEEEGLGVPLFSRMVACGVPPCMLDTQYRMHPSIAQFPSDLFYGGKLLNGVSPPERRPLPGFPWPREEFPVAFIPIYGHEIDDGVSKMNEAEAAAAYDAVAALMEGGCSVSDVAVVTPYAAQVRLIKKMTRQLVSRPPYVEVSSVDGFQGREKEAVIFSAVRSNDHGGVGFVSDWRRVNVSFTRARRALIVVGNDVTLRRGDVDTWAPWIGWADSMGINMNAPGKPRGRYDAEQLRKVRSGTTAAEMLKDVLEKQQAQLKTAEMDVKRANKGRNVIEEFEGGGGMGSGGGSGVGMGGGATASGSAAPAKLVGNFESNWDDDSDAEEGAGDEDAWENEGWSNKLNELGNSLAKAKVVEEEGGDDHDGLRDAWDD